MSASRRPGVTDRSEAQRCGDDSGSDGRQQPLAATALRVVDTQFGATTQTESSLWFAQENPHRVDRGPHSGYNIGSMIAHLRGKLLAKHPNQAIVETAGVGYEVIISVPTFSDLPVAGSEVALHIHTHVREDTLALYGFLEPSEKQLFEKLITVSGIGPKLAITILSGMPAEEMIGAIRGNDVARLTRIPGIGKKTAERMVLELRDKLPPGGVTERPAAPAITAVEEDVLSALMNLGYQRPVAEKALAGARKNGSFDAMFREALATLSK